MAKRQPGERVGLVEHDPTAVQHQQKRGECPSFQFVADPPPDPSIQPVAQKVVGGRKTPGDGCHPQVDLGGSPVPVIQLRIVKGVDPGALGAQGLYRPVDTVEEAP